MYNKGFPWPSLEQRKKIYDSYLRVTGAHVDLNIIGFISQRATSETMGEGCI
jgi:hypothetical protein